MTRTAGGATAPILLAVLVGALAGLGLFTFGYARGASYLTNDHKACANCHVMRENFESWMKSSHGKVAVCNDCHTPPGLIPKYYTKALNGFFHSLAFTTQNFPEQIYITKRNYDVAERACLKCHEDLVSHIRTRNCIQCHSRVGHM
jgi:cytochrome c nitrite reductase small subunit